MIGSRIVILSDLQIPYQNKKALMNVYQFISEYEPEVIASVGDDVDFPQVSRWNKGMEGEYARDLQSHIDRGIAHFEVLRSISDAPIHVMRSNHVDRPLNYIRKYAPGLMGLRALEIPSLLDFDRLAITYHEQPYELAPNWALAHGDEGSLSKIPGRTALGLATKWGMSVVCGHTHRLGLMHENQAFQLKLKNQLFGFEVGNLMNLKEASYLDGGYANWSTGFGILYVSSRGVVTPNPIVIRNDGTFVVEGKEFGV